MKRKLLSLLLSMSVAASGIPWSVCVSASDFADEGTVIAAEAAYEELEVSEEIEEVDSGSDVNGTPVLETDEEDVYLYADADETETEVVLEEIVGAEEDIVSSDVVETDYEAGAEEIIDKEEDTASSDVVETEPEAVTEKVITAEEDTLPVDVVETESKAAMEEKRGTEEGTLPADSAETETESVSEEIIDEEDPLSEDTIESETEAVTEELMEAEEETFSVDSVEMETEIVAEQMNGAEDKVAVLAANEYPSFTGKNAVIMCWTRSIQGAKGLKIHFSNNTCLKDGTDYIWIYQGTDTNGTLVQGFTGKELAGTDVAVLGSDVCIRLVTKGDSWTYYHFSIDSITEISEAEVDRINNMPFISGKCSSVDNVYYELKKNGCLRIYGSGAMDNYEFEKRAPWYRRKNSITSIVIEPGVTAIGNYAFAWCDIPSVKIPKGVTTIGGWAFKECHKMSSVEIPEGVTTIGSCAFVECINLAEVTIPEGVTIIGTNAFGTCTSLAEVTIPKNVRISRSAFKKCCKMSSVEIPEGAYIDPWAFEECENLNEVTIPENVTISDWAFSESYNIHKVIYGGNFEGLYNLYTKGCFRNSSGRDGYVPNANNAICVKKMKPVIIAGNKSVTASTKAKKYSLSASSSQSQQIWGRLEGVVSSLKYSSNNSKIQVTKSGDVVVAANYAGSATITITAPANEFNNAVTKKIKVTVKKITPKITASNKTYYAGPSSSAYNLGVKCTTGTKMSYASSNKKIKVSSKGIVTVPANYTGTTTITIKMPATSISYAATKQIKVTVKKKSAAIKATDKMCYVASKARVVNLGAKSTVSGTITYSSNNKNMKVSKNGKVTIPKAYSGNAVITMSMKANAWHTAATKKIKVSVQKRENPIHAYDISTTFATVNKLFSLNAYCDGKTALTYKSNNPYIKVSKNGTVTVRAGYVGAGQITISTKGNAYYRSNTILIAVTSKDSSGQVVSGGGSSSSSSSSLRTCQQCDGTGICHICDGRGGNWYGAYNSRWDACLSCHGKRTCTYCGGDGIKGN